MLNPSPNEFGEKNAITKSNETILIRLKIKKRIPVFCNNQFIIESGCADNNLSVPSSFSFDKILKRIKSICKEFNLQNIIYAQLTIKVIDQLLSLKINLVIPGHGTPTKKWREAFKKHRNYFITLRDDIKNAISEDQGLQETIETAAQSESNKWELFDVQNPRNVNQVYPQLEWE